MATKALVAPFEFKASGEDGSFTGYGSVFGVRDSYGDVVERGAFKASLDVWAGKKKLPKMLYQHRTGEPIGVWTRMVEDEKGLAVEGRLLLEVQRAKEAYALMKAGALDGLSIGYVPVKEAWDKDTQTNRLKEIDLWEVSPVTFGANPEALIEGVKAAVESPREFERFLREAGLSRSQAKGLMARGYEGLRDLREAGGEELEAVKQEILSLTRAMGAQEH